ncbi:MAG: hypothetical protein ABIK53_07135, partial [bacterium]
ASTPAAEGSSLPPELPSASSMSFFQNILTSLYLFFLGVGHDVPVHFQKSQRFDCRIVAYIVE